MPQLYDNAIIARNWVPHGPGDSTKPLILHYIPIINYFGVGTRKYNFLYHFLNCSQFVCILCSKMQFCLFYGEFGGWG